MRDTNTKPTEKVISIQMPIDFKKELTEMNKLMKKEVERPPDAS